MAFVHLDYSFELCMQFTHSCLSWEVHFLLQCVRSLGPRFNLFRKYLVIKFYFFLHGVAIFLHLITIGYQVLYLLLQMAAIFLNPYWHGLGLPIFHKFQKKNQEKEELNGCTYSFVLTWWVLVLSFPIPNFMISPNLWRQRFEISFK